MEKLVFIQADGVFQKFTRLPIGKDAKYFHTPGKPGLIYIDFDFKHRLDIQALFRAALLGEVQKIEQKSKWVLLGPFWIFTSLERLVVPMLPVTYALPAPEESRLIGELDSDTTPNFFPEFLKTG